MHRTLLTSLTAAALLALPQAAAAQSNTCAARDRVVEHLSDRFGEARQSIGLATGNRVVEMFASPETGTWTLVMTTPDGRSCIIGAGQAWERLDEEVTPAGQPA
ncbi:hypothetical protein [Maritimibacter sp. UBA3975]|uniref:hypothetical protein n=1 Tax=Maritimibacter sp. UBA3975 TaxID=1946833 RepID=UPI000C0B1809|nr:hypothetical protein [Maritimibacter sp. UBA3975]MAM62081.1 hypothetical protein [Maritimibacter sp.]